MSEFEKMLNGELYDYSDKEIAASLEHAKRLCARLETVSIYDDCYRELIEELIPSITPDSIVCPPVHCGHGHQIRLGRNVYINYNCTLLDGGGITIGDNVLIGPNCQLYTPQHPEDFMLRRKPVERALPVVIGEDTWLGGGVIVRPGVTVGKRCIIAAGSVVVNDIPDDSLAAGNPAVVKRSLLPAKDEA
ncbi:MAG: sugar O-acetyltransferase [Prevotella sp.]|nr:sugar O-acetyltransferase [Prevotella sp.]MCD8305467.1 sugar O-acetyltransferase [Prevotella sp.]